MPRVKPAVGERYHIYNRGFEKRKIFFDEADYARMLFYILFLQSPVPLYNVPRIIAGFRKNNTFPVSPAVAGRIIEKRTVELECFSLIPNHLHLAVYELQDGGVSLYMQRIEIAYTKYFNTRYGRSGYLFQGPYQAVHISTNEQFLHLSAYIHRNARELPRWKSKEHFYPWSSYQDYISENRWGSFLILKTIAEQFSSPGEYKNFTDNSNTKNDKDENYWTSDVR